MTAVLVSTLVAQGTSAVQPVTPPPAAKAASTTDPRVGLTAGLRDAGSAIKGGVEQPLKPGDVLYVPPGVPHAFKDINGFRAFLIRMDTK